MSQVVTAISTQTIMVTGGNLFQLAASYLGDATQWYRIAQLNGLSDPQIVGTVKLKIPPAGFGNGGILGL
jgi:hypothetical protein